MKTIKIMTMAVMLAAFIAALVVVSAASPTADDAATTYTTKCVACHGQKAEKNFDSSLPDAQLIDIVMKGKKGEKPPNMPAYAVTVEQAKALVEHMKQLKSAP